MTNSHASSLVMMDQGNPANIDTELYRRLCHEYGGKFTAGRLDGDLIPSEPEAAAATHQK